MTAVKELYKWQMSGLSGDILVVMVLSASIWMRAKCSAQRKWCCLTHFISGRGWLVDCIAVITLFLFKLNQLHETGSMVLMTQHSSSSFFGNEHFLLTYFVFKNIYFYIRNYWSRECILDFSEYWNRWLIFLTAGRYGQRRKRGLQIKNLQEWNEKRAKEIGWG